MLCRGIEALRIVCTVVAGGGDWRCDDNGVPSANAGTLDRDYLLIQIGLVARAGIEPATP
jgi:hypothetical protein